MYRPEYTKSGDLNLILEIIKNFPFASICYLRERDGLPKVYSLPVILADDAKSLEAHCAKLNPLWKEIEGRRVLLSFQGPNAYVSPRWYRSGREVPTWNYVVVQVEATAKTVTAPEKKLELLKRSVARFEVGIEGAEFKISEPDELVTSLLDGIVGLGFHDLSFEAKFKLGQNRERADIEGAVEGLSKLGAREREVAAWMKRALPES